MFRIDPAPIFAAEVRLTVPGAAECATITVTWRHKGRRALRAWLAPDAPAAGQPPESTDAQWLGEAIADWSGPQDEHGQPVAYSPDALAALLDAYPAAAGELRDAYLSALTQSRAKN